MNEEECYRAIKSTIEECDKGRLDLDVALSDIADYLEAAGVH